MTLRSRLASLAPGAFVGDWWSPVIGGALLVAIGYDVSVCPVLGFAALLVGAGAWWVAQPRVWRCR